ncbi:MAG TPA: hypothetical protein VG013_32800 [Gemmataceae bacterium]|nr:hypothetical protein [Gemmataceae bacterium]
MLRQWLLAAFAGLVLSSAAVGQEAPWRFKLTPGQVLKYRVEQNIAASEVVDGKKVATTSKTTSVKSWRVVDVDAAGVATLQLSLLSLRLERTTPAGESLVFDSSDPQKSHPQLREQLSKYVGQPLAVLRVDATGKLVEVKESKYGPASHYESELPFSITLPGSAVQAGQAWERNYSITLEPPQGTGEKYEATQKYTCQAIRGTMATVAMTTAVKNLPASLLDQVPLLNMQPTGGALFNTEAGRVEKAVLRVEKELKGHQGEGSSYKFQSTWVMQYVPNS